MKYKNNRTVSNVDIRDIILEREPGDKLNSILPFKIVILFVRILLPIFYLDILTNFTWFDLFLNCCLKKVCPVFTHAFVVGKLFISYSR